MKIENYQQFGMELFQTLSPGQGYFDEEQWHLFLNKYFDKPSSENIHRAVCEDLNFFRSNDPASQQYYIAKILSIRRGMIAIVAHRIFQEILRIDDSKPVLFELEVLAKTIQARTNIEIHPQAKLGPWFAIDHGHGTVVGATTETGKNVFIYHGVTLGATGKVTTDGRRHPRIGNDIFLGNGVQVLGPSIVGDGVSIGSESMVIDAVIESNVRISPGVLISRVKVPSRYHIFGFDPMEQKFIGRKSGGKSKEIFELEEIDIEGL